MKEGPDIARVAALIGDPARANMLVALLSGKALTASELAIEGNVSPQTASTHLARLEEGGLIERSASGRHRYFMLAGEEVANLLESIMGVAAQKGHLRVRTGPREPALRKARVCYNHLAGDLGVQMYDSFVDRGFFDLGGEGLALSAVGESFVTDFGIDVPAFRGGRRPLCKSCLDWSARRHHLAGAVGTALLERFYELGWARRVEGTRIVRFSPEGERQFLSAFPARP